MTEGTILLVEDDASIARFVELELTHYGFEVRRVTDGAAALESVEKDAPDLVILDLMLPGIDGLEVARTIRERHGRSLPILMLTARSDTSDVVRGFDAGADDYLRKPFEMPELLSRVRALLKRRDVAAGPVYSASGVEIDTSARRATVDGEEIELTGKEFDLLSYLVANAGRAVTREELVKSVWGGQHSTDSNVIEVFMCHLRGKIGERGAKVIQTIRGVGYFFARG
jgi:two-component system, OmpR family, response regulator ArlR